MGGGVVDAQQAVEDAGSVHGGLGQLLRSVIRDQLEIGGDSDLGLELAQRPAGDLEKPMELPVGAPACTFGDVGYDRDASSAHLGRQAEPLSERKAFGCEVDSSRQHSRSLPCQKLTVVAHMR